MSAPILEYLDACARLRSQEADLRLAYTATEVVRAVDALSVDLDVRLRRELPQLLLATMHPDGPPPTGALVKLLGDADGEVVASAALALADVGDADVFAILGRFADDDRKLSTRSGAASTVGELVTELLLVEQAMQAIDDDTRGGDAE